MHKRFLLISFLLLLIPLWALAQETDFTVAPDVIRPGKTERISFFADVGGEAHVELRTGDGQLAATIWNGFNAAAGENHLTWNGFDTNGNPCPPGEYLLQLTLGTQTVSRPVTVGTESPRIQSIQADSSILEGEKWPVCAKVNMPGTLLMQIKLADGTWHVILEEKVQEGDNEFVWDGLAAGVVPGRYPVQMKLTDNTGFSSSAQQIFLTITGIPTPTPVPTATPAPTPRIIIPSAVTTQADEGLNFWTLPVGVMDEAAIWEVMMQPMIVIEGDQKTQYALRKTPDNSTKRENIVGEITCDSQGVHVLETLDNGWSLVEAYNSSYGDRYNKKGHRGSGNTDDLIRGYVKTSLLKTRNPRTDYGLLIDKLEQKMYIFSEGKCIGTLLVSTGLNNDEQPWNETPSGEYYLCSFSGGFPAGNLWCAYGMRVNDGTLIHEVPYIGDEHTPSSQRDYSNTVPMLGKKASHGCIRVQKAANEQGQNIKWLWDNLKLWTKILIWDDTGRFIDYPADSTPLYYNPNNGKNYHEDQYCSGVKDRYLPLTEFSYGELETGKFAKLTPCNTCARIMKKSEIDAINKENGF
ncbi:MAG: hypothetical protein E7324_01560 [Clostridiales bacterium]|nr:hypothetical protein [Clostridiales bacterium]